MNVDTFAFIKAMRLLAYRACLSELVNIFSMCMFQGLKVEVIASQFEENLDKSAFQHPYEYALETARWKAIEVYKRLMRDEV